MVDVRPAKAAKRIVIYVHGGLNDLDAGIARTSILGPYFQDNGIYPIFAVWQSGFLESICDIVKVAAETAVPGMRDRGIFDEIKQALGDATDYLLEEIASVPGTAIWNNMKMRCNSAAAPGGAMDFFVNGLVRLKQQHPTLEIHAVGHSAGSIMIGDMLPVLTRKKLNAGHLLALRTGLHRRFRAQHVFESNQDWNARRRQPRHQSAEQ